MNWPLRLIVGGRLIACFFLLVLHAFTSGPMRHGTVMIWGAALFVGWSLAWAVVAVVRPDVDIQKLLTLTAGFDAIGLSLLTAATHEYRDPFYAWYVTEVLVFSLLLPRKRAWWLSGAFAVSYALGHLLSDRALQPVQYTFMVFNVGSLGAVSAAVALILGGREKRERELEVQRAEVLDLNRRLQRSVAELRAVTEITELIHSTLEVDDVGPVLLNILEKVIDIPTASLYVIDKDKQETIFSASSVGASGAPRQYTGLELVGAAPLGTSDGALSCVQLVDHDRTVVVFCADTASVEGLTQDDRIVLRAVASELVVGVENSRLYRLTKRLAVTDELTGLHNYRYLQQRIDDELGRADRYSKRMSLLMLDVDNFKHVNDTFGHQVGDAVLAELASVLESTVREVDVVARYGGEEFSVILPETDASGAFIVAEKIREAVSLHRFPDADGANTIHVTVSIGLAAYPVHASDKETLLRAADDAVYRAKETGKDRVRAPRLRMRRITSTMEDKGSA